MNENFKKLLEWVIWAQLDSQKDFELLLLKGHLMLELIIDNVLNENGLTQHVNFSFYKKVCVLKGLKNDESKNMKEIIFFLFTLNKLRNKLAHEYLFDIHNGDFDKWSSDVLTTFKGKKFTKFTQRTKNVHAFSALAKALTEIK